MEINCSELTVGEGKEREINWQKNIQWKERRLRQRVYLKEWREEERAWGKRRVTDSVYTFVLVCVCAHARANASVSFSNYTVLFSINCRVQHTTTARRKVRTQFSSSKPQLYFLWRPQAFQSRILLLCLLCCVCFYRYWPNSDSISFSFSALNIILRLEYSSLNENHLYTFEDTHTRVYTL